MIDYDHDPEAYINALVAAKGDSTQPYGGLFHSKTMAQHLLGIRRYELNSHLGNVQVVVSDKTHDVDTVLLPVDTMTNRYPSITATYDYYPFGELMPGRYVSGGSQSCVTTTMEKWFSVWHATPIISWLPGGLGGVFVAKPGDTVGAGTVTIPDYIGSVVSKVPITGAGVQTFRFRVDSVAGEELSASVWETVRGIDYELTSIDIPTTGDYDISFRPRGDTVKLILKLKSITSKSVGVIKIKDWWHGHYENELHEVVVDLCNGLDDPYRFGFNGQQKTTR